MDRTLIYKLDTSYKLDANYRSQRTRKLYVNVSLFRETVQKVINQGYQKSRVVTIILSKEVITILSEADNKTEEEIESDLRKKFYKTKDDQLVSHFILSHFISDVTGY
jgi:hypothetical protein